MGMGCLSLVRARKRHGRRGLELVEFALIVPLLMLILMGLLEYGWLFMKQHEIVHRDARALGRHGALPVRHRHG